MGTDRQRDADLDRLLRATLRREHAPPADACPDAGMLASLVEGGVSPDERAALDTHLAACGRCRDTLAALALDVPAAPVVDDIERPPRPWLWRGHLHWLIPATAATAVVIYVAARPAIAPWFPAVPQDATQVAEVSPATRAAVPESPPRADSGAAAEKPEAQPAQTGPAAAPVPSRMPAKGERADIAADTAAPPPVAAPPSAAAFAPAQAARVGQISSGLPSANAAAAGAGGGTIAWRVGPGGSIWRSPDEGRTWYPQKSGVTAALFAAAAPSATTCWVVGAAGTVLLTDDGERWERRAFPEAVDLVAVEARSSREATVTTRDGRRFTTTDRGTTWLAVRH